MQDFTAIDVETTGLNPKTEKIIEVGAVKVRNGKIVERFDSLVHPGRRLTERITELTGITDEMLKDAPLPEKVIPEILDFIGGDILLGHSIMFDYSFLKRAAVNLGLMKSKDNRYGIDTLKIARCCLRELESRSLPFLCKYYEIPMRHTARKRMRRQQHFFTESLWRDLGKLRRAVFLILYNWCIRSRGKRQPIRLKKNGYIFLSKSINW